MAGSGLYREWQTTIYSYALYHEAAKLRFSIIPHGSSRLGEASEYSNCVYDVNADKVVTETVLYAVTEEL